MKKLATLLLLATVPAFAHEGHDHHHILGSHDTLLAIAVVMALAAGVAWSRRK